MQRMTRFVLLVVLSAFGLLSCWAPTGSFAQVTSAKLPPGSQYVALGSSYASGFGISPQEPGGSACGRSLVDYPHLVANRLHFHLDDVSCAGAVTANVLDTSQGPAPPQIDAVTPETRLVTMTIGGNDVNYAGTAIVCGQDNSHCVTEANPAQTNAAFAVLPGALTTVIKAIRKEAPAAIIMLVTYVRVVPSTACPALHYTPGARKLVASIGSRLENVFVKVARINHIRLVDPYALGASHGPCAKGANKWVAGLVATNGFEYHPTASGHQEMARLVEKQLGAL